MSHEATIDAFWECAHRGDLWTVGVEGRLSREDAYRVQLGMLERYVREGDRYAGWKVGLTAKAMQAQQGVHEPVFACLLAGGERPSGTRFRYADLIHPGFENELCLTVGRTLRGPTTEQAAAALSGTVPALETIERRADFAGDLNLALARPAEIDVALGQRAAPQRPHCACAIVISPPKTWYSIPPIALPSRASISVLPSLRTARS